MSLSIASRRLSCTGLSLIVALLVSCGGHTEGDPSGGTDKAVSTGGSGALSDSVGGATPSLVSTSGAMDGSGGASTALLASGGSGAGGATSSVGASSAGGATSSAGASSAGVGGVLQTGGTVSAGGNAAGGVQAAGGSASSAGATTAPECATNADCFAKHADQPYVCSGGSCLAVTSVNCPVLIPRNTAIALLKSSAPILVGGFVNMTDVTDPHNTTATLNWDLAFDEFNSRTGGLLSYPVGGPLRPFVGVLCQGYSSAGAPKDIVAAMTHLTSIGVTSVLSSMSSATDLYSAWNISSASHNLFFMNTSGANQALVTAPSAGMLWHLLGDPLTLAEPIAAMVRQMEPFIYQQRRAHFNATGLDNPDTEPLRVTMVYSSYPSMLETHDALTATDNLHPEAVLRFNGKSYAENGSNYREVVVNSASLVTSVDTSRASQDIIDHQPHLVLGVGTGELTSVVGTVEGTLKKDMPTAFRPYYLLSQHLYHSSSLTTVATSYSTQTPPLDLRVVGVNYGSALDSRSQSLYLAYLDRLALANPSTTLTLSGTENHYDAAYYLLYAIAAAARQSANPTAAEIGTAFVEHVINTTSGVTVDIGPQSIVSTVSSLFASSSYSMALWATGGYPRFNTLLGTRTNPTSAWCVAKDGSNTWSYLTDGIIYDATAKCFEPNPNGIPACLQNYCPMGAQADAGVTECPQVY